MRSAPFLAAVFVLGAVSAACAPAPQAQTTVDLPVATVTVAATSPEELRPAMAMPDVSGTTTPRTPATRPSRPARDPRRDTDGDGIVDDEDLCPTEREDRAGPNTTDGCPAPNDRDADGVPDANDRCPDQSEDADAFQDEDGCPDPDNDADGVPDTADQCPTTAETKNGLKDLDGCPD